MRKGDRMKAVLKILSVSAYTIKEIIGLFEVPSGSLLDRTATHGQRRYYQQKMQQMRESEQIDRERELREIFETKQQLYEALSKLKADELIQEMPKTGRLKLLFGGKKKLKELQEKRLSLLPKYRYENVKTDTNLKIVSYDIPEKDRRKRIWLRAVLIELKFKKVQQSLWMGYSKIPEEFLNDLAELRIIKYVKIFTISKTGNLDEIKII